MRSTRVVAWVGVVFVVGALAGCGGGSGAGVDEGNGDTAGPPTVVGIAPASGGDAGGRQAMVMGTNFDGTATVAFGPNAATAIVAESSGRIRCLTPPGTGTVDVSVTTSHGTGTLPACFTYNPAPVLTEVDPDTGFTPGGTGVRLDGTGFVYHDAGLNTVTFGGGAATDVVAAGDTGIACTTPAGAAGPVDVVVSNWNGPATFAGGFTYYGFPPNLETSDIRLNTDPAGTAWSHEPVICCEGQNVYVAWSDARNGEYDIYFNRSTDGGVTWQTTDTRLDTDRPGRRRSGGVAICCDGPMVHVTWHDTLSDAYDIFYMRSTDGGATWPTDYERLDTDASGTANSYYPQICCSGSHVYVTWHDLRAGSGIYFNRSSDGGATWQTSDTRLDVDPTGPSGSYLPSICCVGSTVHVVWRHDVSGEFRVHHNRSTNSGVTWQGEVRVDRGAPGAASYQRPRICRTGSNVYVTWFDARNSEPDIYFNRSVDSGATWQATDVRLDTDPAGDAVSQAPWICCAGSDVHVAWEDERNGRRDVYYTRSTDAGATWQAEDTRLDTDDPGARDSYAPVVCCDGSNVFVAWYDAQTLNRDIYLRASWDGGATWQASNMRVNTNVGTSYSYVPQICCRGARVYMAWWDDRAGDFDIYFSTNRP